MLTRPGSEPGPERMRTLAGSPEGFRQIRKATSGIRVLCDMLQVASISVADFARLSRVWPARRRDAAAVPGRHRGQGYRPRRRCHRNCRYRRSERLSYRVRSNRRWRLVSLFWLGSPPAGARGSSGIWPPDLRCDWPVCVWTWYCVRILRSKR